MISDLVRQSQKGFLSLFFGQIFKITVQVINLVVLARFLSPEDYGLTAVAVAIVGLGEIVRDFGLSSASIQSDGLSQEEKSNLFWLNALIGFCLTLIVFVLSSYLAAYYDDDRLDSIVKSMSVIFLINGVTAQYKSGLFRDLRFKAIAFSESIASFVCTSTAIYVAYLGHGFWAIVIQQILFNLILLLSFTYLAKWIPSMPNIKVSVRRFISYGKNLMGSHMLVQFSKTFDTFIIGDRFGAELLGVYNRAQQIVFFGLVQVNAPSTSLALPILSKLKNNDDEYYRFLIFGQSVFLHVISFSFSILAINSDLIIRIVLGERWLAVAPVVQILCLGAVFQAASYCFYWVFVSKGLTKEHLYLSFYTRPVVLALIAIGGFWSVYSVAFGVVIGFLYNLLHAIYVLNRRKIRMYELLLNAATICGTYIVITCISLYFLVSNLTGALYSNLIFLFGALMSLMLFMRFRQTAFCLLRVLKFKK